MQRSRRKALNRDKKSLPIRKCISCGKKNTKNSLLKLVINDKDEVEFDYRGSSPGRGAYVCRRNECIVRAMGERVLCKAFRRPGPFICRFCGSLQ
ncbi:MAG TPA: YlxR family protein [Desulfobacteraceae bacterium]|nr:YlxR family protein [Desulfobacteraceae bacterium]